MGRSISTCMRNAVAGFSIMWVYKRARARARSVHFETAHDGRGPVTHILRVENTRSGPARAGPFSDVACSMKKKKKRPTGSPICFAVGLRRRRRRDASEYRDSRDSLRVSTFYTLFLRVTDGPADSENVPDGRFIEGRHSGTRRILRSYLARRNYVLLLDDYYS